MASAVRSTDLAVTSRPAKAFICSAAMVEGRLQPTSACMRRTPGEQSRSFDIETGIGGKLAVMAVLTQVPGPQALPPRPGR